MTVALLIEMGWKSGLVAAVALLGAVLLRTRPAAERVALLRLGVVLILALPLLSLVMPAMRVQAPVFTPPTAPSAAPAETGSIAAPRRAEAPRVVVAQAPIPTPVAVAAAPRPAPPVLDAGLVLLVVYGLGVALLAAHLLTGVATLSRWTRRARPVADPAWLDALERAAQGRRRPTLLASSRVSSPLSWGWRPAVILLNEDALPHAERADAVLAHEMGHVRRGDWLFLMLSRAVVALFWFNPLVWLLQGELARQSERAVDAWAVRHVGRADYASALVAMAGRRRRPQAALGMAGPSSDLARRVAAVLAESRRVGRPWPTAIAALACVGVATPLAAVELSDESVLPAVSAPALRMTRAAAPTPLPPLPPIPVPAFAAAPVARPGDPVAAERLALVLRQRRQGLNVMEIGARVLERRARDLRDMAARLSMNPEERDSLMESALELDRDAEELRAEARDLAARNPAALQPLTPEEEREMFEDMQQVLAADAELRATDGTGVQVDVSGALRTDDGVQLEASGAVRTPNGVQLDASGAVRTPSGVQIDASGVVRTSVQFAAVPAALLAPLGSLVSPEDIADQVADQQAEAQEQRRQGALEMRQSADQMDAAAAATDQSAVTVVDPARRDQVRASASELRRQATDLRRRAGEMERGAP